MLESKLVKIYLSLNKEEHRLLTKWIASPIANVHEDVRNFIAFLDYREWKKPKVIYLFLIVNFFF